MRHRLDPYVLAAAALLFSYGCSGGEADPAAKPSVAADAPPAAADAAAPAAPAEAREPLTRERMQWMMSGAELDALEGPRGVRRSEPQAFDGLTLIAPLNSTKVLLIDMAGEIVHTWETGSAPGAWCYLLADGTLLHSGREDENPRFNGGGIGGRLRRFAPDGTVIWRHTLADETRQQHHDVRPMPNGNLLAIVWERKSAEEAIARGRRPDFVGEAGLWPDAVLELEPTGAEGARVVWEWHAWDHLVQDVDPKLPSYGAIADHPGRIDINATYVRPEQISEEERKEEEERATEMAALGYAGGDAGEHGGEDGDEKAGAAAGGGPANAAPPPPDKSGDWLHTNAVDYHAELDLIVLSSPRLSEVFVIDHGTTSAEAATSSGGKRGKGGDLLWRWGNPVMHGAGTPADQQLFHQHDATWLVGADGPSLLVFNNGGRRHDGKSWSSVVELALPFDREHGFVCEARTRCGPPEPAWSYSSPDKFFSDFISGAQRLPNGNTLICSGAGGHVFEVTRDGSVVWDFANPFGGDVEPPEHAGRAPPLALFRATRLSRDHPGVQALLR